MIPELTLGFLVADWIEAHCVIPDGFEKGAEFKLSNEQLALVANHYAIKDSAQVGELASAFEYRRSQYVRAQKNGKSPMVAAFICAEGVGPVVFDGFAQPGEVYDCRAHGCGCGWVREYEPLEPKGQHWPTPLIQLTATTEDQVENTYDALRPMIEFGPLSAIIPRVTEEFIRLPNSGRIDVVTSKATSRLGQRVTFVVMDETGIWTEPRMQKVATTQRRGLAGMGGRSVETTNAWDPSENSVAQQTFESQAKDIYKDFKTPPNKWQFSLKTDRRKIFKFNYSDSPWVNIDAIEAEAAELLEKRPAEAERFFGNRIVAGDGKWLDIGLWEGKADVERRVPDGSRICLGFDGSDTDDWSGIRAETLDGFQFTPRLRNGRLTIWDPKTQPEKRVPRAEVNAAVEELFARFNVIRMYCDPPFWQSEVDVWAGRWEKRVFPWATYRPSQMHAALERLKTDVTSPDSEFTHDGCELTSIHIRNAVERPRAPHPTYLLGKASQRQKIDLAMSSALVHEAAGDAIAKGANAVTDSYVYFA